MKPALSAEIASHSLEQAPFGLLICDANNKITWINQTLKGITGGNVDNWLGKPLDTLLGQKLLRFSSTPDVWHLAGNDPKNDRWYVSVSTLLPDKGRAIYLVDSTELVYLRTQVKNLTDQLDSSIAKDPLTGLLNPRATQQALDNQVSRSRRYNNPLSIVVIDVGNYRSHMANASPTTDQVIKAVSFYLRDQMRWVDHVGRTGDKEFTLVLPETKEDDAQKLARKISERLNQLSLPDAPNVTVSVDARIGVVSWKKGDDAATVIKRARAAVVNEGAVN